MQTKQLLVRSVSLLSPGLEWLDFDCGGDEDMAQSEHLVTVVRASRFAAACLRSGIVVTVTTKKHIERVLDHVAFSAPQP